MNFSKKIFLIFLLTNFCVITLGRGRSSHKSQFASRRWTNGARYNRQADSFPDHRFRGRSRTDGHWSRFPKADRHVHFYIYPEKRDTGYKEEIIVGNNATLSSYMLDFNPIILIPDYMQNYSSVYPQRTIDAYLKQNFKANVIVVDWSGLATPKFGLVNNIATRYPKVSRKVQRIAKHATDLLFFLQKQGFLYDPEFVHMIGFGLGAQIAGVTGNNFKRASGSLIGRITGLDPSGLQYHYTAMSEKLDKSDAAFVDIIHTTKAPFGFATSVGSVDFYPNGGGPTQPGCHSILDMMKDIPGMDGSCAHNRAWDYFTDSIFNKKIYACQASNYLTYKMKAFCSKPVIFGQYVSTKASGDYFLDLMHQDS